MSQNPTNDSKALTVVEDPTAPTIYPGVNRGQLDLLKRTLARGTTDDEFALFMNMSQRLGIDPFARQIYAVKRWTRDEDTGQTVQVMAVQVGIDGFRAIAEATDDYHGQEGPYWCGDDGVWKEAWISDKPPAAAKVVVYRKGVERGFVGVARYRSFVQTRKDGGPVKTWATMPDVMLGKCAEAQALRKAFPKQLSGIHTDDEMGQAGDGIVDTGKVPASAIPVQASVTPTPQQPKTTSDVWPAFLAEITPAVSADLVEKIGKPIAEWGDIEVWQAIGLSLDAATTIKSLTEATGPWSKAINKFAASTRIAALKAGAGAAYSARKAKLEEEAKAQNGGAP